MVSDSASIELSRRKRVVVVRLRHDVDLENHAAITAAFRRARTDPHTAATLVDLGELGFADSTLLNLILRTRTEHDAARRPFVLAVPDGSTVRRLFDITGVSQVLATTSSPDEALRRIDVLLDTDTGPTGRSVSP